jgi:predicted transposase YbfD/YdcC
VAAFDQSAGAVLGQLAVATKSNEIPALRDLLDSMDITDAVVSADAMHCVRHEVAPYEWLRVKGVVVLTSTA